MSRTNEPGRGLRDPSRDHGRGWEEPGKDSWGSAGEIRLPIPVCQQWEEGEALSPLRAPLPSTQQAALAQLLWWGRWSFEPWPRRPGEKRGTHSLESGITKTCLTNSPLIHPGDLLALLKKVLRGKKMVLAWPECRAGLKEPKS